MLRGEFQLPIHFDLAAVTLLAATGALAGVRKRYDLVGTLSLALVAGLGGGFLRDGIFLQGGPPASLTDGRYLVAVLLGGSVGTWFGRHLQRLRLPILVLDALALGIYGVVGAQKSLDAGLPALSAGFVGVVNAVGGGLLRDLLTREEPLMFQPGEFYALAAIIGQAVLLPLVIALRMEPAQAAVWSIAATFAARLLSIRLGWRTEAPPHVEPDERPRA
ncbi:trimeric intracellular cation channel family protein [Anaeromyxobacter paludicola]|uniref:UPF0126 membrane protein n=1 Tax=Anaeromyxobacter paludicola TaxID=2918171 RepID=A0ABM7XA78_9BACT|nr:TRIC cation channel family protein [Anaeromyxobacter paludicola]BDG08750.1 UPF0126 membrane protein [Anaeromyxobacter paludicola]